MLVTFNVVALLSVNMNESRNNIFGALLCFRWI